MSGLDPDDFEMILETFHDYAAERLTDDYLLSLDKDEIFPDDVLRELYEDLGLHLIVIAEEYGGLGGGAYHCYRLAEDVAAIDLGIATSVLATFLGMDPIIVGGTEEQKDDWMSSIAEQAWLVAYGASEPQAGSDLSIITTKAERIIEDGEIVGYKLNGRKQWISNGGVAKLWTILALTPNGPSWFTILEGDEGFSTGKPEEKHGIRTSNTTALYLEDVIVEPYRLVGEVEGKGMAQAQAVFGYTRLMVGSFGLGGGWGALRKAISYSQERVQGGSLLSEKQAFTHKLLVPNVARLEAARAYIEWVAEGIDSGEGEWAIEGAVSKYMATEAGNKAAEDSIQALGGYGYTREYMVEKMKRDTRITTIYEGTSEILEQTISRDRWQQHLRSRGGHFIDWAEQLEALATDGDETGLAASAHGLRAIAELLERCREGRLMRSQHVQFRMGELIAWAETAAVFSKWASRGENSVIGIDSNTLKALARIFARESIVKVIPEGLKWVAGGGGRNDTDGVLSMEGVASFQSGMVEDMNDALAGILKAFPL